MTEEKEYFVYTDIQTGNSAIRDWVMENRTTEKFDYKRECGNLLAEKNALLYRYEELRQENNNLKLVLEAYKIPEVVKVLTDWRTGELQLQEEKLEKYKKIVEEAKEMIMNICGEECNYRWESLDCGDSDCRYNQIFCKLCEVNK